MSLIELPRGVWDWIHVTKQTQRQQLEEARKTREALERLCDLKEYELIINAPYGPGSLMEHLRERRYDRANGRI